ncbi:AAA family ATPase [Kovacikia minuta]
MDLGKKGRNLLIYGENGSGKSSLLKAIELFIDSHV